MSASARPRESTRGCSRQIIAHLPVDPNLTRTGSIVEVTYFPVLVAQKHCLQDQKWEILVSESENIEEKTLNHLVFIV